MEKCGDELLIHATCRVKQGAATEDVGDVDFTALVGEENQLPGGLAVVLSRSQVQRRQRVARLVRERRERPTIVPGAQYSRICSGLVPVSFFHWYTQSLFYLPVHRRDIQTIA